MQNASIHADYREAEPFLTAEEAWFWCCLCESRKQSPYGASNRSSVPRPCESNDILIVLKRLVTRHTLNQSHVRVLSKFGLKQEPPHIAFGASLAECKLWNEAMFALEPILIQKGIVLSDTDGFCPFMYLQCNYN